ncbi:hypothetical protein B0A49_04390 [Cryomyces minteri]|uniref:Uncharacterized protein n=1 Tax=Cryomyces minteri TaxID=331657 RepID=A0A4U0X2P0_9PEZI|nr:hypothetical protein B0A49_04390 [Cryomyces minteri]
MSSASAQYEESTSQVTGDESGSGSGSSRRADYRAANPANEIDDNGSIPDNLDYGSVTLALAGPHEERVAANARGEEKGMGQEVSSRLLAVGRDSMRQDSARDGCEERAVAYRVRFAVVADLPIFCPVPVPGAKVGWACATPAAAGRARSGSIPFPRSGTLVLPGSNPRSGDGAARTKVGEGARQAETRTLQRRLQHHLRRPFSAVFRELLRPANSCSSVKIPAGVTTATEERRLRACEELEAAHRESVRTWYLLAMIEGSNSGEGRVSTRPWEETSRQRRASGPPLSLHEKMAAFVDSLELDPLIQDQYTAEEQWRQSAARGARRTRW